MSNPYTQDPNQQSNGQQSYGQQNPGQQYGQQPYGQQAPNPAPYQNPYQTHQVQAQDPGQTMGIVGLILAFFFAPAGLVVSIIARKQSKEAGFDNGLAKAGFILSLIFTILWVLYFVGIIIFTVVMANSGY